MLNVVDNFGVCCVMCIKVLGGLYCCYVGVGDIIKIIIKEVILCGKVKKGDVLKVVVVCIKKGVCCLDGFVICFDGNVCVILNNNSEQFIGMCIFGLVICEFCNEKFMKIIFLVLEVF